MRIAPVCLFSSLIFASVAFLPAQVAENKEASATEIKGVPPRANPGDYQAQATVGSATIAADFAGHSVPKPEGPLSTEDFIVFEVAYFGAPGSKLKLSTGDFTLRINGKKGAQASVPFGVVAPNLKDPEWQPPEGEEHKSKTGLSSGTGGDEPPAVVKPPFELRRAMALYVQKAALPEGERPLPQAGLIFFRYTSKVTSLHSIELIYTGPAGTATLSLQP